MNTNTTHLRSWQVPSPGGREGREGAGEKEKSWEDGLEGRGGGRVKRKRAPEGRSGGEARS